LDLSGWVKNRADGSVELEAEGHPQALERLRAALADGPDGAQVAGVDDIQGSESARDPLVRPFSIVR
jgi:acylphosphatase